MPERELLIGTDFSGINAPVHALEKMGANFRLVFHATTIFIVNNKS